MLTLRVKGPRLLVQLDSLPETMGGLFLPEQTEKRALLKAYFGTVLHPGTGKINDQEYKTGDRVAFMENAGWDIDLGQPRGVEIRLFNESECFGDLVEVADDEPMLRGIGSHSEGAYSGSSDPKVVIG